MQMYLKHFNLSEEPFSATPDTRFYVENTKTLTLFSEMIDAINQSDGFINIIGDAGAGKTLHCRKLLNALRCHKKRYLVVHIPHSRLSEEGLYLAIAQELKIKQAPGKSLRETLIIRLTAINEQWNVVIIIDEGQSMSDDTLEALVDLVDQGQKKLLRVALFSMPLEAQQKDLPAIRAIENLTTLKRDLHVFDKEGVIRYIETRLVKAGYQQDSLYSLDASLLIAKISKGVPRVINLLAQKALINTFNAKLDQVQAHQVRLAAATIDYAMLDELDSKPSWFKRLRSRKA